MQFVICVQILSTQQKYDENYQNSTNSENENRNNLNNSLIFSLFNLAFNFYFFRLILVYINQLKFLSIDELSVLRQLRFTNNGASSYLYW